MKSSRYLLALGVLAAVLVASAILLWPSPIPTTATGADSITTPDTAGDVGWDTSLVLDASGNPVVSYYDNSSVLYRGLKVLHCNDPNCSGGDESISSADTDGDVGDASSLVLDVEGYPVVSHYDVGNGDLKLLHCNDPNCSGGDESSTSPDTAGMVGGFSSLALDASGFPVVSYRGNNALKVLHCNDPNCSGGDESITSPDTSGNVGRCTSLMLDGSGNPVVSYYDGANQDLKVLHCNDPDCSGGDESITSPDTGGNVGYDTSLALDASGNPVISYFDWTNWDLKVMHCNDPNCSGSDESITSPDTSGELGYRTSIALDTSGHPVVSYYDYGNGDLKVLHCNDPNCSGGDESVVSPDTGGDVGQYTSLALDSSGHPVVSYHDDTNGDLKVLHCGSANCSDGKPVPTPTPCPTGGCPTPTTTPTPGPPPEVEFSLAIEGTSCTTKVSEPGVCNILEGSDFTAQVALNSFSNLPDDDGDTAAGYVLLAVSLGYSSGLTLNGGEMVWPDCEVVVLEPSPPSPYNEWCQIGLGAEESTYLGSVLELDFTCAQAGPTQTLTLTHGGADTFILDETGWWRTDSAEEEGLTIQCVPPELFDTDGDGCPDADENGPDERLGGQRDYTNPWDYFNPTNDGENRVDDILAVVSRYFLDVNDPVEYAATGHYYDRTMIGPNEWNLGPPNGEIRVDDILHAVNHYFHDCGTGVEKPTPTATPVP